MSCEKVSCNKCPSSFELIPPADKSYSIPKENVVYGEEHIPRIYECEDGGHRNTIYWHKKSTTVVSVGLGYEKSNIENISYYD